MIVGWRGVAVELAGPAELVEAVRAALPPFYADLTGPPEETARLSLAGDQVTLELPDGLGVSGPPDAHTFRACASRVELVVADRLPDLVAVHAGVVGTPDGVIVLPGRSMAGKSTLVRALVDAGADYWSDEFALLDGSGLVHPYPRAMTLRTPTGSERHVPPAAVDVEAGPRACHLVGVLAFGDRWEVTALTPGEATMALIDNCVSIRRDPARALTALTALAEGARALGGTRGEASETAAHLLG